VGKGFVLFFSITVVIQWLVRLLLYETEGGQTCVEYDRPSSIFGQFGDDRIALVAASLDEKLAALAATTMR
jgi:hypothetical protein